MLNKILGIGLVLQVTILLAILNSQPEAVMVTEVVAVQVPVEVVIEQEPAEVAIVKVAKSGNEFNFVIPKRRVITEMGNKGLISLSKEVNLMGTLGEAFMDNPLVKMSMEKRSRKLMKEFFADFIRETNLSPEEQLAFFQVLDETMQSNMRSLMTSMGENMELMKNMRKDGLVPELTQGIKENNLSMNEELKAEWGDEKTAELRDYHLEKSLNSSMHRINNSLKDDNKLSNEQNEQVQELLESRYRSPFSEDSYDESFREIQDDEFPEGLSQKQKQQIRWSERKNNGLFLAF